MWPEVATAKEEGRRELVLTGPSCAQRIAQEGGVDEAVYSLTTLNFLEVSNAQLGSLSDLIGNLVHLTNLVLRGNKLALIPEAVGRLQSLKFLDVSNNQIEVLPESLCSLPELMTLDVRHNKLVSVPVINKLVNLHELFLSGNHLKELPEEIAEGEELIHLHTLLASHNEIEVIPEGLSSLPALKHLDLANNCIGDVPADLSQCLKLKELALKGNKLKDRRFLKLVDQCQTKSLLDYLSAQYAKQAQTQGASKKVQKKKKGTKATPDVVEKLADEIHVLNFHASSSDGFVVQASDATADVRPYIICCIVRHVNFKVVNTLKKFISLQTKLHEGICDNRLACTIATHDLKYVKGPVVYDARNPKTVQLVPLGKSKEQSAAQLMTTLRKEADEQRKEKKRNTLSGIHKYLDLLKDKQLYPFLLDATGCVISFPPITNCESTKISTETTDILIEVTSSKSMGTCKEVMDEILREMLAMGLGRRSAEVASSESGPATGVASAGLSGELPSCNTSGKPCEPDGCNSGDTAHSKPAVSTHAGVVETADDREADSGIEPAAGDRVQDSASAGCSLTNQQKCLVVEQVRIVDSAGALKVVYPSKTDLQHPNLVVIRC